MTQRKLARSCINPVTLLIKNYLRKAALIRGQYTYIAPMS